MKTANQIAKHTPGPWYAIPGPSFDQILIGRSPAYDPRPIATVNPVATHESDESVAEQKANARLIAAAPDMDHALDLADELERIANQLACATDRAERNRLCVKLATAQHDYKEARAKATL